MKRTKKCVVKRKGRTEKYDEKKVYASIYAAALNCEYSEKESEKIALKITKKVNRWFKITAEHKICVSSDEIRDFIIKNIEKKDIKLMYKHHLDLS